MTEPIDPPDRDDGRRGADGRFLPGQSGNNRGRPRKKTSGPRPKLDLRAAFLDALNARVVLRDGSGTKEVTAAMAGMRMLIAQYGRGDRHARRDVMALAERFGIDLVAGDKAFLEEALKPSEQQILDDYVALRNGMARAPRVIAPPDLLDGL